MMYFLISVVASSLVQVLLAQSGEDTEIENFQNNVEADADSTVLGDSESEIFKYDVEDDQGMNDDSAAQTGEDSQDDNEDDEDHNDDLAAQAGLDIEDDKDNNDGNRNNPDHSNLLVEHFEHDDVEDGQVDNDDLAALAGVENDDDSEKQVHENDSVEDDQVKNDGSEDDQYNNEDYLDDKAIKGEIDNNENNQNIHDNDNENNDDLTVNMRHKELFVEHFNHDSNRENGKDYLDDQGIQDQKEINDEDSTGLAASNRSNHLENEFGCPTCFCQQNCLPILVCPCCVTSICCHLVCCNNCIYGQYDIQVDVGVIQYDSMHIPIY